MSTDWLFFAFAILLFLTVPLANSTTSKTIVFIAGWPQSGTSMLHKFLSLHPGVSTMMERCVQRHGKKCENWNYEGQWLLSNSTLRQKLHSGSTCPITQLPHDVQDAIFGEWNALWDASKPVYVEKSPQSLVKIASLREIYESRGFVVKVIVVIKHPVTINTMTPRKYGWRYERDVVGSSLNSLRSHGPNGARPAISLKPEISPLQMEENMRHFLQTLHHRHVAQDLHTKGANCSLGWLDAYEELLQYLQAEHRADKPNKNVIRVVHYESFLYPIHVCQQILSFIFSSATADPIHRKQCSIWFGQSARTTDLDGSHGSRGGTVQRSRSGHRNLDGISESEDRNLSHRLLRLRGEDTSLHGFQFKAQLVRDEGEKRLKEFQYGLTRVSADLQSSWMMLQPRIRALGYLGSSPLPETSDKSYSWSRWALVT